MKTCNICKIKKIKDDYSKNNANPDKLDYFCKECKSLKAKNKRRNTKIYLSAIDGFDENSKEFYFIEKCEVCNSNFYPIRKSHKRCAICSNLVRDTQSHLSGMRSGEIQIKCSVFEAIEIVKIMICSKFCCYCKRNFTLENNKSIDHIIPITKGGNHKIENINISCLQCNLSKRALFLDEWITLCKCVANNS